MCADSVKFILERAKRLNKDTKNTTL